MDIKIAILLCILVVLAFFFIPYHITDGFKKNKYSKFIPSILCAVTILLLDLKFNFTKVGYSEILDIALIIIFAGCFLIFFMAALVFQYINR